MHTSGGLTVYFLKSTNFKFRSHTAKNTSLAVEMCRCLSCFSSQVRSKPMRLRLSSRMRPSMMSSVNVSSWSGFKSRSWGVTGRWAVTGRMVSLP